MNNCHFKYFYATLTVLIMCNFTTLAQNVQEVYWGNMKFSQYNWRRISTTSMQSPELKITTCYSRDYDHDTTANDISGNIDHFSSMGIGLAFLYQAKYDQHGTTFGFGVKSILYPNSLLKFSATIDAQLLGVGDENFNIIIVPGVDLVYSSSLDFERHEWHYQVSLVRINLFMFSTTLGFQSPFRYGKIDNSFDDSHMIIDLTYRLSL